MITHTYPPQGRQPITPGVVTKSPWTMKGSPTTQYDPPGLTVALNTRVILVSPRELRFTTCELFADQTTDLRKLGHRVYIFHYARNEVSGNTRDVTASSVQTSLTFQCTFLIIGSYVTPSLIGQPVILCMADSDSLSSAPV